MHPPQRSELDCVLGKTCTYRICDCSGNRGSRTPYERSRSHLVDSNEALRIHIVCLCCFCSQVLVAGPRIEPMLTSEDWTAGDGGLSPCENHFRMRLMRCRTTRVPSHNSTVFDGCKWEQRTCTSSSYPVESAFGSRDNQVCKLGTGTRNDGREGISEVVMCRSGCSVSTISLNMTRC